MFVALEDYHGNPVRIDPTTIVRLRSALPSDEHDGCTLVDWGSGGVFASGELPEVSALFAPHVRLARLHAPDGRPLHLNADSVAAVLPISGDYVGVCMVAVKPAYQNLKVPKRNNIPLKDDMETAQRVIQEATTDAGA